MNAASPISSTPSGSSTSRKDLHRRNASAGTALTAPRMRTRSRRKHPRKAPFPSSSTLSGNSTSRRFEQPTNASAPTRLMPSGMLIVCSTLLNANARSPMASASSGTSTCAFLPEKRVNVSSNSLSLPMGRLPFETGAPPRALRKTVDMRMAAFFFELQQHMAAYGDHPCTNPHIFPAFRSQNEGNVRVCLPFLPALRTQAAPGARTPRPCA